jgi:hypothetical protein
MKTHGRCWNSAIAQEVLVSKDAQFERRPPWPQEDNVVAQFALTNLQKFFLDALKNDRGIHVETLMTVIGALAGFSAQHAIWETVVKSGKLPVHGGDKHDSGAFVMVGPVGGETYYFGNLLNSYLVNESKEIAPLGPGPYNLWGFLAAVVVNNGREPLTSEQVSEIFSNVATTIGTPQFGQPRSPVGHEAQIMPRDALKTYWPSAKIVLSRDDAPGAKGRRLSPAYWPMVIGIVGAKLIDLSKKVLDPALSMRIVFEAAVPMSKVDPKSVPQEPSSRN